MNQMDWKPQQDVLNNVLAVLQDSFVPDSTIQKDVQAKLNSLQTNTDLFNYFLLIFADGRHYDEKTRALSGLILKNNLTCMYSTTPPHIIQALKAKSLYLLSDQSHDVRSSASALIIVVALRGGLENWPELLPYLISLLDGPNGDLCETTIKTLINICEDYLSQRYHVSVQIDDSIKRLLQKFVELTSSNIKSVRKHSFKILNEALQKFYPIIRADFDAVGYLQRLIAASEDPCEDIVYLVCQGFVIYVNNRDEAILPLMGNVIGYIMVKSVQENEEVALQAFEFWYSLSKLPTCRIMLGACLPTLVQIIMNKIRYSAVELASFSAVLGNDSETPDRPEDVKPFSKNMDDEDEDDDIGWTLRKCSAASLDGLSVQFQADMVPIAMPLIMSNLESGDLLSRESGILALGAIAEGCFVALIKYLPDLIPPLIRCMEDPHPLIRSITCWTLSRYVRFIIHNPAEDCYFVPVMSALLSHSLDENKRVQRAAISAFCFFQEEAKAKLFPYIEIITNTFLKGFEVFKQRSLYLLYDAIGVFAISIGDHFNLVLHKLMGPIMCNFNAIDDLNNCEEFLDICECLSAIIIAVQEESLPYAETIFQKCSSVITDIIQYSNECEGFDKDLISGALDLLVPMACHLKGHFPIFVSNSILLDQLFYLVQDESLQVRQPALAFLGEIVRVSYQSVSSQIHVYIPAIVENLDKRFNIACNNAAWVIGKLCLAMQREITPYAGQIIEHCVEILQSSDGVQTMFKTVAIALCTLGMVCPEEVFGSLKSVMRPICVTIRNVADCDEKEIAFRGLCELVVRTPDVLSNDFVYFCDAIASWNEINCELKERIQSILFAFKQHVGDDNWNKVYAQFPPMLRTRMAALYGV